MADAEGAGSAQGRSSTSASGTMASTEQQCCPAATAIGATPSAAKRRPKMEA